MRFLTVLLLVWAGCGQVQAQGENNNWAFNFLYGLNFRPSGPAFVATSFRHSAGGCSAISDANGRLLFYTNGNTVWDSQHTPMTNACGACDGTTAQLNAGFGAHNGTLIVKRPGSQSLYYVFTTDSQQNLLNGGLSYTEVDMSLRSGLGGVTAVRNVRLPTPTLTSKIAEGVVGMQHANRRDVWVVVHGLGTNSFYSLLVTSAGVSPAPVTSTSGSLSTNISIMAFAPDGKHLVRAGLYAPVELFDFNGASGLLSNAQVLDTDVTNSFLFDFEFSADASKLYQSQSSRTTSSGNVFETHFLCQYDLRAGSPADVRNSKLMIYKTFFTDPDFRPLSDLEIGPDGRIYATSGNTLGIIDRPNRRGLAANFRPVGLPVVNVSNITGANGNELQNIVRLQPPSLDFMAETACAGSTVQFAPYEIPTGTGPLTWTFSDPLTGLADSVQGTSVTRTYPLAGTYTVTLSTVLRGQYYRFERNLIISPLPALALPDTIRLCGGSVLMQLGAQPAGTTFRWSDGSASSQLAISQPGKYWVKVRNYQGCERADTTVAIACQLPNVITPNGDAVNETFRLEGLKAGEWSLDVYNRWGRLVYRTATYDNRWNAQNQSAGIYYYLLRNRQSGQRLRGCLEVIR
ncbi:T9SS type B sorting domain-containing protein [Hymenobacter armeniacus]|nr:gliding motility-associated C-terminal domain-containing protein [Hymenobacter armeniacus]